MIASDVHVTRYRYAEKLHNGAGLWQTSSLIEGKLPDDFRSHLGDILFALLPAGSVTGAPKKKTLEIISKAENFDRGFYTGVMGLWDGNRLNSAVMIRLIDKHNGSLHYKAGGGITAQSHWESEYSEICNKVYLPIH
jgi:para-aminobenzoate synthetase component 1